MIAIKMGEEDFFFSLFCEWKKKKERERVREREKKQLQLLSSPVKSFLKSRTKCLQDICLASYRRSNSLKQCLTTLNICRGLSKWNKPVKIELNSWSWLLSKQNFYYTSLLNHLKREKESIFLFKTQTESFELLYFYGKQ